MKIAFLLPAAILIAAIVLSLAARGQFAEKRRLEEEFAAEQERISRSGAADMAREWARLDESGRLVATLAGQMAKESICQTPRSTVIYESFRALAAVVPYYRGVALASNTCPVPISAVDPSEKPEIARWITSHSLLWASQSRRMDMVHLEGPIPASDGREFFFTSTPAPPLGSVVLAVEARLLFQRVLRARSQDSRYVLLDPDGGLWFGCSQADRCTRVRPAAWQANAAFARLAGLLRERESGISQTGDALARSLGMAEGTALAAWSTFMFGEGRWVFAVVASPHALNERGKAIFWRLVLMGLALALAVGGVAAVGIILQRRQGALQERLRLTQQEADLKAQIETIINNVPAGLVGVSEDGRVTSFNRFITERYSSVRLGAPIEEAFPPEAREGARKLAQLLREAVRTRRQITMLEKDADLLSPVAGQFEVRVIPIDEPRGEHKTLVLVEDLGEVRKLERQLIRAEKLATVGVLTAGLAHEIGTPLGIIRVRAETVLEGLPTQEGRNLASILGQIDRISTTIRQLLDFSREQTVSPCPTDAGAVAKAAGELLSWRFLQKALSYQVNQEVGVPPVAADAGQLQQVMVNLIMNACDACRDGGRIVVRLEKESASRMVRIEVEDNGCGIAQDQLNAVFDPFFTTKKRGEGTGLGLSVVTSIVRNHGGQVSIASTPGEKTTVTIFWPIWTESRKGS